MTDVPKPGLRVWLAATAVGTLPWGVGGLLYGTAGQVAGAVVTWICVSVYAVIMHRRVRRVRRDMAAERTERAIAKMGGP